MSLKLRHFSDTTLKVLMDAVFGPANFRNEVIWKRTSVHSGAKRWGPVHDTILFYSRAGTYTWNRVAEPYDAGYVDRFYKFTDDHGRYRLGDLTGAGTRTGDSGKPWRNVDPTRVGRHWAVPNQALEALGITNLEHLSTQAKLDILDSKGLIHWPPKGKMPQFKRYLDEEKGVAVQDVIVDIRPLSAHERLGYPTEKPLALLERIINASSNPGDIVLDPFCGCGTAVHAAQKLGRRWIGIDITYLAINLIENRMKGAFPGLDIKVIGEPTDLSGARDLAHRDKWQFQWWALMKLGAQPIAGKKKGADKGIDGVIPFYAGNAAGKPEYARAIVSVKGGEHVGVGAVRDLKGVLDREGAPIGILLTLNPPTKEMITEAAASGFYENDFWKKRYPRVQILTVLDLLKGKKPEMPWGGSPFAKAPVEREQAETERML